MRKLRYIDVSLHPKALFAQALVWSLALCFAPPTWAQRLSIEWKEISLPDDLTVKPPAPSSTHKPSSTASATPSFKVQRLLFEPQTLFSNDELCKVAGFTAGELTTIHDLHLYADRVTAFMRSRGLFLSKAVVQPQEIDGGLVRITALVGQYQQIQIRNRSAMQTVVAQSALSGIQPGDTIALAKLEERLLLLSDMPAVEVKSTLAPGAQLGTADLVVDLSAGPRITGQVDVDNAGGLYTGENRLGVGFKINQLLGLGDGLSVRAQSSLDGMSNNRVGYQLQWGATKWGASVSNLNYRLNSTFSNLQAEGTAVTQSVYVDHALVRGKSANLNALINWDQKDFHDKVYSSELLSAKTLQNTSLGFSGDIVHALNRPTQTQFSLLFSAGNVKTAGQDTTQSSSAAVAFGKANINLSHIKSIASGLDWQWSISGQTATTNLDVAEKMPVGGVTGVRAYPANEAYADVGFVVSSELRKNFSSSDSPLHQLQWIGFVDIGQVQLNKESTGAEADQIRRSGFGMGIHWVYDKTTQIKTLYAQKIASADENSTSAQGRIWVQGYRSF